MNKEFRKTLSITQVANIGMQFAIIIFVPIGLILFERAIDKAGEVKNYELVQSIKELQEISNELQTQNNLLEDQNATIIRRSAPMDFKISAVGASSTMVGNIQKLDLTVDYSIEQGEIARSYFVVEISHEGLINSKSDYIFTLLDVDAFKKSLVKVYQFIMKPRIHIGMLFIIL